jgi:hypothetical protein
LLYDPLDLPRLPNEPVVELELRLFIGPRPRSFPSRPWYMEYSDKLKESRLSRAFSRAFFSFSIFLTLSGTPSHFEFTLGTYSGIFSILTLGTLVALVEPCWAFICAATWFNANCVGSLT